MTAYSDGLIRRALAHQHQGDLAEAVPLFQEALRIDPKNPQAHFSLGVAARAAGHLDVAIFHLRKAAAVAKKDANVHQQLGLALLTGGAYDDAAEALQKAATLDRWNAESRAYLGDVRRLQHRAVLAEQAYDQALKLDPENGAALVGQGQLHLSLGRFDAAEDCFRRAIALGKELPTAYYRLSTIRTFEAAPAELTDIERLIEDGRGLHPRDLADLHWAAGKIRDDIGEADRAFDHYEKARELVYPPFDAAKHHDRMAALKELTGPEFFRQRAELGSDSQRPVFVFGMPRSGTTLVEQIIARHSKATGAGELPFFHDINRELGFVGGRPEDMVKRITALGEKDLRRYARRYLAVLQAVDGRAERVVDKMPHNFESLWLLAILFPNATFVHTTRSPADTCVSLLCHPFNPTHSYNRRQDLLGGYYREYAALMEHWAEVLPVEMRVQSYERLVFDQEAESRALIRHVGLAWEDRCLEFYKGERPVTTFSETQVRRPIFKSSVERWRRYRNRLDPLFAALGDLAPPEITSPSETEESKT